MLSYFVNPLLNITNREAQENIRSGSSFNQYLHYNRGFNHLLKLDYQIRTASSGKRSLNNIVPPLLQRRKDKQYFGLDVNLSLLRAELGEQGIQDHNEMTQGNTILPVDGALGPEFKVVRDDKAPVELGFDESTMTARIVKGLKPGSRAAEAGLRKGDVLVKMAFLWQLNEDYEKMMWMDVKRDNEVVHIKYWPRATEKVPCWQWVEV
jgi:predicted metalloprotease with PDZ domain